MSFPSHSPQPQVLSPSETGRKLPLASNHLVTESTTTTEAPGRDQALRFYPQGPRDSEPVLILPLSFVVPLSSQVTSQVTPSRMTPLPLWDLGHEANARPQLVVSWGICGYVSR